MKQKSLIVIIAVVLFSVVFGYCIWKEGQQAVERVATGIESCFEDVTLSGNVDSLQVIKLFKGEDNGYYVYMPSEMRTNVNVYFTQFQELQIGDVIYKDGDSLTDIYKDMVYPMVARERDGTIVGEATVKFYFTVEIPSIYIESDSGTLDAVNADKNVKEKAKYSTISASGELDVSGQCTIKARGNTSFGAEQKSYSINLNSKESLFGMPFSSEWAIVANYENSIHQLKNKIVLDIAKMLDMPYTPECHYVNVFINNQYNGLYLLTQKVSADGGSVQLDNAELRSGITGPYLLEFDARYKDEPVWFQTNRKNVVVKYPKVVSEEALAYIAEYVQETEETIFSGDEKSCFEYIDLESWTSMYLMQEFFAQWDVEFASFYMYKYVDNPLIYAGPVWDFDLAYGNTYPGYYPTLTQKTTWIKDCRGGWLAKLDTYQKFHQMMTEKYLQIMSPAILGYLENTFDEVVSSLVSSSYMNAKRWNRGEADIRVDAETLRDWMNGRKEFLEEYLTGEEVFHRILFQFGWGNISYYVKDGEQLGFLPMKEYGEVDYLEDKEYGYGSIREWQDSYGNLINIDTVINEDIECFAIYE